MHRIVVLTVVLAAIGGTAAAASPGPGSSVPSLAPEATCAPSPGYLLVPPVGAAVDGRQRRPAVPHAAPALISRPPAAEDTIVGHPGMLHTLSAPGPRYPRDRLRGAPHGERVTGGDTQEASARAWYATIRLGPAVGPARLTGRPAIRLPAGPARWHRG